MIWGWYRLLLVLAVCQKLKILWHLKFFSTQDHMGLQLSKRFSSYSFHLMSAKLYEDISCHGGIRAVTFLGNQPSFVALWILTCESMGKPKMWILSRKWLMVERNRRKFGTRCTTVHICRVLWCRIPWVWFGVIQCTLQNFQFYNFLKTLLLSQFSSDSSKLYKVSQSYRLPLFWRSAKNCKSYGTLWNFLNTGPYAAGIFSLSKLCDNIGYHGNT